MIRTRPAQSTQVDLLSWVYTVCIFRVVSHFNQRVIRSLELSHYTLILPTRYATANPLALDFLFTNYFAYFKVNCTGVQICSEIISITLCKNSVQFLCRVKNLYNFIIFWVYSFSYVMKAAIMWLMLENNIRAMFKKNNFERLRVWLTRNILLQLWSICHVC